MICKWRERITLVLGNIDAKRDWGHAKDYVYGVCGLCYSKMKVHMIMYLATNEYHSVREFVELAFKETWN